MNDTVIDVGVAEVMVPTAPLFNVTALLATVGSKPNPLIVTVEALAATCAVDEVTTGVTSATCTGAPLLTPVWLVTTAVKLPAVTGRVVRLTVNEVEVAAVIDPTAPLSNVIASLANVVSNPNPAMMTELAFAARNASYYWSPPVRPSQPVLQYHWPHL